MVRSGIGVNCFDKKFRVVKAYGSHYIKYECKRIGDVSLEDMKKLRDELNTKIKEEEEKIANIKKVKNFYEEIEEF